jgi:hypothetical protein
MNYVMVYDLNTLELKMRVENLGKGWFYRAILRIIDLDSQLFNHLNALKSSR